jgi:hypothetical protein
VRYRRANEQEWHTGTTQSISLSGAVILADEALVPAEPVEIAISLPAVPGCLVGRGHIVRSLSSTSSPQTTFAVSVERYRIGRLDDVLSYPKA